MILVEDEIAMNVQLRDLAGYDLASFVSAESFWVPDQFGNSAWVEHAPFGFWLVDALSSQTTGLPFIFCASTGKSARMRSTSSAGAVARAVTAISA